MSAPPALELRDLHKRFGQTEVIRGLCLSVQAGERIGIIGPNGAGKSTLFDLISGRQAPSGGQVWLDGQRIDGKAPFQVNRLGLARSFQTSSLFPSMSVFDNLRCGLLWQQGGRYSPGAENRPPSASSIHGGPGEAAALATRPRAGVHVFGTLETKLVLHDFALDGNLFQSSHSVTRIPWVAQAAVGFSAQSPVAGHAVRLAVMRVWRSREFEEQGPSHAYGSVTLSIEF